MLKSTSISVEFWLVIFDVISETSKMSSAVMSSVCVVITDTCSLTSVSSSSVSSFYKLTKMKFTLYIIHAWAQAIQIIMLVECDVILHRKRGLTVVD